MATNPDSPAPKIEDELLEADLPGWSTSRPPLDQLDPALTTVTTSPTFPPMTAGESPYVDEDLAERDPPESHEPPPTKREATSPPSAGELTVAAGAAQLFALAASVAGFVVNMTLGRKSGAYLMQPDEAQAIGEPLGRIAARRVPIGDAEASDVGDGLEAAAATTAYAARATIEHFAAGESPDQQDQS